MEDLQSPAVKTEVAKVTTASSYMATIQTKWLPPSNRRGSRIKATSRHRAGAMYRSCDDGLRIDENHEAAAKAMLERNEWTGDWVGAQNQDGSYTWVCASSVPGAGQ